MYDASMGSYCASSMHFGQSDNLHDWEMISETPRTTTEYCKRCGLRTTFYKADNTLYLKTHKRDFLQPHGATKHLFAKEYGEPNYEAVEELTKEDIEDIEI